MPPGLVCFELLFTEDYELRAVAERVWSLVLYGYKTVRPLS